MRFIPIDQIRGLAISAMILAHFGPGIWDRIGITGPLLDVLLLIGRFATPTFIAIFGFTIAFAYISKSRNNPAAVRAKLFKRSGVVLLSAIVVSLPSMISTLQSEDYWGGSLILNLLLNLYGVLIFYTLAIFSAGLLIGPISRAPYILPAVIGSVAVFVGTFLGYDAWESQGQSGAEIFRLVLVSGKYAFFTNFGVALMLVSLGWYIKNLLISGCRVGTVLLVIGIVMLFCGLSLGRLVGWRSLSQLHSSYGAPPQLWYLCVVGGVMLMIMAVFDSIKIPFFSFFLEHTGRNPLAIYVSHAFVLPAVSLLRSLAPWLPNAAQIMLPLCIFFFYWAFIIIKSSRPLSVNRTATE